MDFWTGGWAGRVEAVATAIRATRRIMVSGEERDGTAGQETAGREQRDGRNGTEQRNEGRK
jgi:hypothetical protein